MTISDTLRTAFWLMPLLLQPLIALWMIRRKQVSPLAIFFVYTLFVCGRDFVLLLLRTKLVLYRWIYWLGEPVTVLLGLAAICQVLWHQIRDYAILRRLGVWLIPGALIVDGIAAVLLLELSPFHKFGRLSIESARLFERSAWFIEAGVLITVCSLVSRIGLDWKLPTAGIVVGFGISAGLQLAFVELESLGLISVGIFPLFKSAAYDCAVIIWFAYFFAGRSQHQSCTAVDQRHLRQVDQLLETYLRQ